MVVIHSVAREITLKIMFNRIFKNSKKMETKVSIDQETEEVKVEVNTNEETQSSTVEDAILEDQQAEQSAENTSAEQETVQVEETTPEEDIAAVKASYDNQIQELKDKYLRLRAEFDNYKKRTLKERLDLMKTASRDTMTVLLPILDDFDRAEKNAHDNGEERLPGGVQLVVDKMRKTLEQKGLKPMETNGEVFDPELHEAITEIPASTEEMKGKVVDTIEKGYYLNDVIIRYARVVVGK